MPASRIGRIADADRMYATDIAQGGASESLGAWFAAGRALDRALDAFETAGAALSGVVAETDWHADGVRALHTALGDLLSHIEVEHGRVAGRQWELERMAGG